MERELVEQYVARYDFEFSIMESDIERNVFQIDLNEQSLSDDQSDWAENIMALSENTYKEIRPDQQLSAAMIFYGFRLGALKLKNKCECITRQSGYRDTAIWNYNLDELLDAISEPDNPDTPVSNLIDWIINPESNIEVADEVFEKMVLHIINRLAKSIQPGKQNCCTLVFPPISKELAFPDWKELLSKVRIGDATITILDYGELFRPQRDERNYVCIHQTDGEQEYLIITAYEIIRGQVAPLGSIAFDLSDKDAFYELQTVHKETVTIDNHHTGYEKKAQENIKSQWDKIPCQYPVSTGFRSFLGKSPVTFHRELYKLQGQLDNLENVMSLEKTIEDAVLDDIRTILSGNQALQINEIASILLGENQLQNISLGDIVFITSLLEKSREFNPVSINTTNFFELGTDKYFAKNVDMNDMPTIPANYASFTWKLKTKAAQPVPYFKLDGKKHSVPQMIQSIILHYDHCTTEDLATDLLFLHGVEKDPSAYYTAKVFMFLTTQNYVVVDSHNEVIQIPENVDSVEYQEVDKSSIKKAVTKREPKSVVKTKTTATGSRVTGTTQKRKNTQNQVRKVGTKGKTTKQRRY